MVEYDAFRVWDEIPRVIVELWPRSAEDAREIAREAREFIRDAACLIEADLEEYLHEFVTEREIAALAIAFVLEYREGWDIGRTQDWVADEVMARRESLWR